MASERSEDPKGKKGVRPKRREAQRREPRRPAQEPGEPAGPKGRREAAASERRRAERLERLVAGFGTAVVVGLALVGVGPSTLGALLTLVGLLGLGASTHAFGRLGPDESFDPAFDPPGRPGR